MEDQSMDSIQNPESDLFSDAMDRAVSMFHSVRHGAMRNAERAGEQMDGELLARRALAAGIAAYLEELRIPLVAARQGQHGD
jgi:hypothetical protein